MKTHIKQWGNSAAVRLPMAVLIAMKLGVNSELELTEQNGQIILTPVKDDYSLDALVNAITPNNIHEEYLFGSPIGKECW